MNRLPAFVVVAALALASPAAAQQVGPLPDIPRGSIALHMEPVVTGLNAPLYAISPPGDPRLFIVEQKGTILIYVNGAVPPAPALDIQSRVSPPYNPANANDERGLLGLAFHPGFHTPASPGYQKFYTFHTEPIPVGTTTTFPTPNADPLNPAPQNFKTVVAEWSMSAGDPNVADPLSRREVVSFGKTANNHNGGTLTFGPDGYLYLAPGDGGNANDVGPSHFEPGGNGQYLGTPLGKMLRFDPIHPALTPGSADPVSANGEYRIAAGNPFTGPGEVREIYAYGFRNPYRFAFDFATGDLILADVGQNQIEEVNRVVLGGNYGWPVKEGEFLFNRANGTIGARTPGSPAGMIDPISGPLGSLQYDHSDGISITGGFVYRGAAIGDLFGKYVFGDLAIRNAPPRVDGRVFYADLTSGEMFEFEMPEFPNSRLPNQLTVHGFGQDQNGALYAAVTNTASTGTGGILYRLDPMPPVATVLTSFDAVAEPGGIRLRWRFLDPLGFASVRVERGASELGPWAEIEVERQSEDGAEEAFDRGVAPGTTYFYRLIGVERDGSITPFAPVAATAEIEYARAAFTRIAPNPSSGPVEVEFVLPRAGEASLRVLDLQGRVVATLAEGSRAAGRHRLSWSGAGGRGPLASGVYFVELRSEGGVRTRRIAVAH